jgi:N-acetylglucosaminyl-diphospho-decaprenol L-rhamnosyltransferase
MKDTSLEIVIVNWNSKEYLKECLQSISTSTKSKFKLDRVTIIDNASTDHSLDGIENIDIPLNILLNSENKGFGAACNQGGLNSNSKYLLFLNPDTVLSKESLDTAIEYREDPINHHVGLSGIQLVDDKDETQRSCSRFPTPINFWCDIFGISKIFKNKLTSHLMTEWKHDSTQQVDHVMGAFYLIKTEIFRSLNGFDEDYFVYLEDLDLSYRVNQSGWSCYYLNECHSFHKGGGTSEQVKPHRLFYSLDSKIIYAYKHFTLFNAILINVACLTIEPVTRICFALLKGSFDDVANTIQAYNLLLKHVSQKHPEKISKIYRKNTSTKNNK